MTAQSNFEKVKEFHSIMGMSLNQWPPSEDLVLFRDGLIDEELLEFRDEFFTRDKNDDWCFNQNGDKQKVSKELADLLYVVYGTAAAFGIPIDEVFDKVHKSNMSKLVDGKPLKREDGKILKGPNYQPPDLSFLGKDNE